MLVDDLPEARGGRIVRDALEHQGRGAVGERAVDDVAVAGHPADIRRAPINVAVVIVEDVAVRRRDIDEVAAGRVQHALRLAGRARRIEDEERVLGAHLLGRALRRDFCDLVMVPEVAAGLHGDGAAGAPHDQHVAHRGAVALGSLDRLVGIGLERNGLAAAQALVGGDDEIGAAILDAVRQRIRREAAEDHGVDGADARAGEHRIGGLGDHRHVDGHAVAALDAVRLQHVCEAADMGVQLAIGDRLVLGRVVALPQDGDLLGAVLQVSVDAVGRHVQRAVLEPFDGDVRVFVGGVLHLREGLLPVHALRLLGPETVGVVDAPAVHLAVRVGIDIGPVRPFRRNGMELRFRHEILPARIRRSALR